MSIGLATRNEERGSLPILTAVGAIRKPTTDFQCISQCINSAAGTSLRNGGFEVPGVQHPFFSWLYYDWPGMAVIRVATGAPIVPFRHNVIFLSQALPEP